MEANFQTVFQKKGIWHEAKVYLNGKFQFARSCRRKSDAAEMAKKDIVHLKSKFYEEATRGAFPSERLHGSQN